MAKGKKTTAESEISEDKNIEVAAEVAEAINETTNTDADITESEDSPGLVETAESTTPAEDQESSMNEEIVDSTGKENENNNSHKKSATIAVVQKRSRWQTLLVAMGLALTLLIFVVGGVSQLYKAKVLPGVRIAGTESGAKNETELKQWLQSQEKSLEITFTSGKTELKPQLKDIGYEVDVEQTVKDALAAKRDTFFGKFAFWKKQDVPVVVHVNNTLLSQYIETKLPKLTKSSQDARLEYNASTGGFVITPHKDGSGVDVVALKKELEEQTGNQFKSPSIAVKTSKKPARITRSTLEPLLEPAEEILSRTIILEGSTGVYQAQPSDIAFWITPTPQKDGQLKIVIDEAKVESYVESVGRLVSSTTQDKKIIKDKKTKKEVVLQEGRNGTELADKEKLASQITQAVQNQQDVRLSMSIKTAKYKTVHLKGYDKWIEVDLSEQRVTAYEGATAIKTFIIASGMAGHETPVGEYAIWLKVRKQTMQGGSKADGSYYNIPNVEWVSYFYQDYALHGAWWRKKFGAPASHGCVNMTNADAQWVYNWAPMGTKVLVHQ